MSRYQYTNIKRNSDTKVRPTAQKNAVKTQQQMRETTIYPTVERSTDDLYLITQITDRLDLLADKYYNDSSLWWVIALANNLGKGTLIVEPGIQLRIPNNPQSFRNALKDNQL